MKILFILLFSLSFASAETKLLIVGGGKRPVEAMKDFVESAGGEKASILVISWASATTEGANNIRTELLTHNPAQVEIAATFPMPPQEVEKLQTQLTKVTGIFFTGGNQNHLMKAIKTLNLKALFKAMFSQGVSFAGTSAGTAVMSDPMLKGNANLTVIDGAQIELTEGLGLLPAHVIVDQHFVLRKRFNRLAGVILSHPAHIGLGVDEGTSLFIKNNEGTVLGPTEVLIFKQIEANKLTVEILKAGQKVQL
jgi:cyanophycinase